MVKRYRTIGKRLINGASKGDLIYQGSHEGYDYYIPAKFPNSCLIRLQRFELYADTDSAGADPIFSASAGILTGQDLKVSKRDLSGSLKYLVNKVADSRKGIQAIPYVNPFFIPAEHLPKGGRKGVYVQRFYKRVEAETPIMFGVALPIYEYLCSEDCYIVYYQDVRCFTVSADFGLPWQSLIMPLSSRYMAERIMAAKDES